MQFEFDPAKSATNKDKHGIDFAAGVTFWFDDDRIEVEAHSTGEERFFVIGRIAGRFWTAICTRREQAIRIISVRRSREKEKNQYEDHQRRGAR